MGIKDNRTDLSEWIIHFVHDRRNDQRPEWLIKPSNFHFPDFENEDENEHYEFEEHLMAIERDVENWNFEINEDEELTAFEVIKLILSMGYIRAGFSYRNEEKTIYGNRPAVCFTEMPLYALIQYAKNRSKSDLTSAYAIAFPRKELYNAGARNVFYGLSSPHKEAGEGDPFCDEYFHRNLSSDCGIALNEQYRYVYTNLKGHKIVDWTHEREWRLACDYGDCSMVGLNFLRENQDNCPLKVFSEVVVIVNTNKEVEGLLKDLAQYYHGDLFEYSSKMVERIKIISIEQLKALPNVKLSSVSIDSLHYCVFSKHTKASSSQEQQEEVIRFLKIAEEHAEKIHIEQWEEWINKGLKKAPNGDYFDLCAHVNIVLSEPTKPYSNALIELGYACPNGPWGIVLREASSPRTQSSTIKKFYAENIIKKLEELTGEKFSLHVKPD